MQSFLNCVDAYVEDSQYFPVSGSVRIGAPNDPQELANRRHRIDQLRKFTAPNDVVYLPSVVASLARLAGQDDTLVTEGMTTLLSEAMEGQHVYVAPDGTEERSDVIVRQAIYATRLHGDHDKQSADAARDQTTKDVASWSWLNRVEHLVLGLGKDVRRLIDDGAVPWDPPEPELLAPPGVNRGG